MTETELLNMAEEIMHNAWQIIVTVNGGNWDQQSPDWKRATIKWRDNQFYKFLSELRTAEKTK